MAGAQRHDGALFRLWDPPVHLLSRAGPPQGLGPQGLPVDRRTHLGGTLAGEWGCHGGSLGWGGEEDQEVKTGAVWSWGKDGTQL